MQPLSKEEFKKRINILMGEACFKLGLLHDAFDAFRIAGDKAGLFKCAEAWFEKGEAIKAVRAQRASGQEFSKEKLFQYAEICLSKEQIADAFELFKKIGNRSGFYKCAEAWFELNNLDLAEIAFNFATDKAGLFKCAEAWLKRVSVCNSDLEREDCLNRAHRIFECVGDQSGLSKCAEVWFKIGSLNKAEFLFRLAKNSAGRSRCGDMFLKKGLLPEAVLIFRDLGDKIGLSKCAEFQITKGNLDDARQIFSEVVLLEERDLAGSLFEPPDFSGK